VARARLTYPRDAQLLDAVTDAARLDSVVLLVRHGSAGDPEQWTSEDRLRPLDPRGQRQAQALRRILPAFAPTRLLSVDNTRCRDTVTPLAADLGLAVEPEPALEEQRYAEQPMTGVRRIQDLARGGGTPVVCSQGTVIPDLIATLAAGDGVTLTRIRAKKGSVWALFFGDARLAAADYYPSLTSPHARGEQSASARVGLVADDLHVVEQDDALGEQLVEPVEEGADALVVVDDNDHDGQVLAEGEQMAGVDLRQGREAFHPAQRGGAGQAVPVGTADDLDVERPVVPLVGLVDEDGQPGRGSV
jgi:broad specificity phosphatase PhoE